MTLFALDDVLERTVRERMKHAPQVHVGAPPASFDYFPFIPHGTLTPELGFSSKHGPFVEYLAQRDLRSVQREVAQPRLRALATHLPTSHDVPSQVVGFQTGLVGDVRYEALWSDVVAAAQAYHTLRTRAKVRSQRPGNLVVDYGDNIVLRVYGLEKNVASIIDADLEGIPSSNRAKVVHAPHYKLETLTAPHATGVFHIDSGYAQHRSKNWTTNIYYPDPLSEHASITKRKLQAPTANAPRASKPLVNRVALYAGDLLGLYLLEGVARRQYNVALNQPLPALRHLSYAALAHIIGEQAIMLDKHEKRHKPSKQEWNHLIGLAMSS